MKDTEGPVTFPGNMSPSQGISRVLADFVAESRFENLPPELIHEAKRSLLNGFATALAGASDPVVDRCIETLASFSGPPSSGLVGRRERFDGLTAAFLNAVATNVHDFDDTHTGTIIHPTAPVSPVVFVLAETQKISGRQLLEAFILGVEAECRIGNSVSPGHYKRGWHITSTCGVFGAAVAAGKLRKLDCKRMLAAIGIASAQAGGLVENLGTMAKSVGVGNAARNGLVSALMAETGVEGPSLPLEGERGFLKVTCDDPRPSDLTDGLGEDWQLSRNTYKPYPCGVVLNPVIEACLEIAARQEFDLAKVQAVTVSGHSLLRERTDRPDMATGREAQVSAQHAVSVCLMRAAAGLDEFSDAAVHSPEIRRFRGRVRVEISPDIPVGAAAVTVHLANGDRIETYIGQARGDEGKPLSDKDLEDKLRKLAAYGSPGLDVEPLIKEIWKLEELEDAASLMKRACLSS